MCAAKRYGCPASLGPKPDVHGPRSKRASTLPDRTERFWPFSRGMRLVLGRRPEANMRISVFLACAILIGGCTRENDQSWCASYASSCDGGFKGYGDGGGDGDTTASGPTDAMRLAVAAPCQTDADCSGGKICNVGRCATPCAGESDCGSAQTCFAGRCYLGNGSTCGISALALCSSSDICGEGRACSTGTCRGSCGQSSDCGLGQVCSAGACAEDPHPQAAQCVFNFDCGAGFRCINAYCHPLCASDGQCTGTNVCDHGVCRANERI